MICCAITPEGTLAGKEEGRKKLRSNNRTAAALPSILHDHRRIVEFDGGIDVKLRANHRCDPLVHEGAGGMFIVPQIDSASGPAIFRTQELFPDQPGHVAKSGRGLVKRGANLNGGSASRQLKSGNDSNHVLHGTIDTVRMASVNGAKGVVTSGLNQDPAQILVLVPQTIRVLCVRAEVIFRLRGCA